MNDSAIKSYCIWARRELIAEVERRCAIYDITEKPLNLTDADAVNGRVLSSNERHQRAKLLGAAREEGCERLAERAAYTWFNRIMAIRFMEVNDLLPSHTRMLSGNDGTSRPQALAEALVVDIEGLDRAEVARLVQGGDDEATFRCVFLAQCAELHGCMPDVFEVVGSAMELLLPDGLLREGGVVDRLVSDIPEDDWHEGVQIVGWMYQYYVLERKDDYFASKRKASAEDIPCATQLFTPDWIVHYLAENSLGRLWMLNNPASALASKMDYYLAPDSNPGEFLHVGGPEEITVLDPACGSGHILVYAFDLLASMYEERGYARRDIPRLVLERNLTGIEIDPRAAAMASFALTMKACKYDRRFLRRGVRPRVTVLQNVEFSEEQRRAIVDVCHEHERLGVPSLLGRTELVEALAHLDEAGSLFEPSAEDMDILRATAERLKGEKELFGRKAYEQVLRALAMMEPLVAKYDLVIANPPYLQKSSLQAWAARWIESHYPEEKNDLCTCFIKRGLDFIARDGYAAEITMQSWMFLSSYEKMRKKLIATSGIVSMAHMGARAFDSIGGEVVSTTATIFSNSAASGMGSYFRLVDGNSESEKAAAMKEAIQNPDCGWLYRADAQNFKSIPGWPIAYWFRLDAMAQFKSKGRLGDASKARSGLKTGKNKKFLRSWYEVSLPSMHLSAANRKQAILNGKKWFPHNKGGDFRKWYGNRELVVNFQDDGREIHEYADSTSASVRFSSSEEYFHEGITWTALTTGANSFRYSPKGCLFDSNKGPMLFPKRQDLLYSILGFLNSSTAYAYTNVINPSLSLQNGDLDRLPFEEADVPVSVQNLVNQNVSLCVLDYNSFETSWDFSRHPLVEGSLVLDAYDSWCTECQDRFDTLKSNEEELNRIFARIYHMEGEVPIEVPADKVSVRLANLGRDVRSLVSYAVGCIMGRYSLDKPGLVLANQGDGLNEYLAQVPNPSLMPDDDGIIPLTDVEYFHDDAVGLFVDFLKAAYGPERLGENLRFVADALGGGDDPRQVVRDYFRNDFFKDHCRTYSVQSAGRRPIYWLFDSGKKGGFRALFYMHRYTPDLLARLRTEYVHPQQERYRNQIDDIDRSLDSADRREAAALRKHRKILSDQLAETNAYEEKVHHLADQMIKIDLDDGVRHNYALFQDVLARIR